MRSPEHERYAETLGRADGDIGTHLAWRGEQGERQQVGGDRHEHPSLAQRSDELGVVAHQPRRAGILEQDRVRVGRHDVAGRVADDNLDAERQGTGPQDLDGLGMAVGIDEEGVPLACRDALEHRHRLGGRRRLVEERGVGQLHAGEIDDHGLEVEQRLEPALGDLRLVRRVRGVPARVLEDVPLDHRGGVRARVPHADERGVDLVLIGETAKPPQHAGLGHRTGNARLLPGVAVSGLGAADRRRHRPIDELVEVGGADGVEHRGDVGLGRADVTADEVVDPAELCRQCVHLGS